MDNSYIFPQKERDRFKEAMVTYWLLTFATTCFLIYKFFSHYRFSNSSTEFLFVAIGITIMLYTLGLIGFRYIPQRYAKYFFDLSSLSIQVGHKKRSLCVSDTFYICTITMLYAGRYYNMRDNFIVLWSDKSYTPVENTSPYVALRKNDIIILPCEKKILKKLNEVFAIKSISNYPDIQRVN